MTQSVEEQIGILPAIETEAHLFKVRGEMLRGNLVPRPHDSALEQAESGPDGAGKVLRCLSTERPMPLIPGTMPQRKPQSRAIVGSRVSGHAP